jgi:hypothetical protein
LVRVLLASQAGALQKLKLYYDLHTRMERVTISALPTMS